MHLVMEEKSKIKQNRACLPGLIGKQALRFSRLAQLLTIIFNFTTTISVSCLHLGQYRGNLTSAVSSYTFVRDFLPHNGQGIHNDDFSFCPNSYLC